MLYPDPNISLERQSIKVLLRLLVAYEARGEKDPTGDLDGVAQLAILHVFRNRSLRSHKSMKDEVLKKYQVSSFMPWDPNYGLYKTIVLRDPIAWARADAVCDLFEEGLTTDPTGGARNYYNPSVASPPWGRGHPDWKELYVRGKHIFGIAG